MISRRNSARVRFNPIGTAALFLAVVLLTLPSITRAQQVATPKRILLLYWQQRDYAGNIAFEQNFRAGLKSAPPGTVEYYSEYLESDRFPGEKQSLVFRDYLRTKYADRKIDVILAVTDQPLTFLLNYRHELFAHIPIVFVAVQSPAATELAAGPGITGIVYGGNQSSTLDLALRLHPGTEQVFVVSGTLQHDKRFEIPARQDLEGYDSKISITYLTDLPLGELIVKTSSLPERSMILYLWQQSQDEKGNVLESQDVLALIARSAPVPIYGLASPVLGSGVVGGNLRSPELMATRAAEIALRVANGARARDIPVEPPLLAPMFDWRQLKRWGIREANLPPGSIVRFKEPTLWEQHRWSIIGFITFCLGQTLLIVGLFVQRKRRKRVETALAERELRLRESQAIAHVGSFHWDVVLDTMAWSDEMCRIHGSEPGELSMTYETYLDHVHPDDREQVRQIVERSLANQESFEHEYRIVRGIGETRWLFVHGRPVVASGGNLIALQGTCQDITEHKEAEEALRRSHAALEWRTLQLRRLASDLTLAEQHVREELAKTLHDGLQQLLFCAVVTLDRVLTSKSQADQITLLQRARADIQEAKEAARTLSVNLFPPILHIGGLPPALAWLAKRTQDQYSVAVNVTANPHANPTSSDVRILLFEAVRELLFNAVKHAHVDRIDVSLEVSPDDTIQIQVSDEGVGFDPGVILHRKNDQQLGLGLFSIEERIALFGGHLDIQSAPGKGARFSLTLPCSDLPRPILSGRSHDVRFAGTPGLRLGRSRVETSADSDRR